MMDFINAALPWIVLGIAIAVWGTTLRKDADKKKQKSDNLQQKNSIRNDSDTASTIEDSKSASSPSEDEENYMTSGMCLGMCFGVAASSAFHFNISYGVSFGLLIGMIVGMNLKK